MPDTPIYAITYPCLGDPITAGTFATFATDVEAALATVDAEATAVTHFPTASLTGTVTTPPGVEATMNFTTFAASSTSTGFTVNNAAGTVTIITPGLYKAGIRILGNQATLTMTSQRGALYVNGVLNTARKYRGFNPVFVGALSGHFDTAVQLAAGDVLTMRYLWTGTGVALNPAQMELNLQLLATP